MRAAAVAVACLALLLAAAPAARGAEPGVWERHELDGGSHVWLYLPASLADAPGPHPAVLYLHGAGSRPFGYRPWIAPAAEAAGLVAVLPKSSTDLGWGLAGDGAVLAAALNVADVEIGLDEDRLSLAGHSAGGTYAFLLTYAGAFPARAVFSMSAPFYPLSSLSLAEAGRVPPIHMYYGADDPNETGGSHAALRAQWARLDVAQSSDVRAGYGHNSWPQEAVDAGFAHLAAHSLAGDCVPSATVLCLGGGRFRAEVDWQAPRGFGEGQVVDAAKSDTTGLFWFFAPANWELMVKLLDGCAVNGHHWVFASAATNVAYTLTVTDTEGGGSWSFENPSGRVSPAVTDTRAFDACP